MSGTHATSVETAQDGPIVTTTDSVPGAESTAVLGVARGNTVEARNAGTDFVQNIKNFFGGELTGYSELLSRAREEALDRMVADAEAMGADAVVNVRFETSEIANAGAEVIAYGTAVELDGGP